MPAIFLSYRRADSLQLTIRLREWLVTHGVPAEEVFFDERSIPVGARFPDTLSEAVAGAKVVLVVIGPGWAMHATGALFRKRSLWRAEDWVRREVELALVVEGRAQPVLVDATVMPEVAQLPESMRALRTIQAARVRVDDAGFEQDMPVLAGSIAPRLAGTLDWVDGARFVYLPGARRAYLAALERRYAELRPPVGGDVRLPFDAIVQPLHLRRDPLRPAAAPRERPRHDKDRDKDRDKDGDGLERERRGKRKQEDEGHEDGGGQPDQQDQPQVRAENGWQALELSTGRRIVVLGGPGTGKSTLLRRFVLDTARAAADDGNKPLPILLSLPELARAPEWEGASLSGYLRRALEGANKGLPAEQRVPVDFAAMLAEEVERGAAILCLDGLDEVQPARRRAVLEWINALHAPVGEAAVMVGSRFTEYKSGELAEGQFAEWELEPLRVETRLVLARALVPPLVTALHPGGVDGDRVTEAEAFVEQLRARPNVGWWGENPLLFTLAAFVYVKRGGLPPRRVELYDEVVRDAVSDRLEREGIRSELVARNTLDALGLVALGAFAGVGQTFTVDELATYVRLACAELHIAGEGDMDTMFQRVLGVGLIEPEASETYRFRHLTFQEYLAGAGLAFRLTEPTGQRRDETRDLIERMCTRSRWNEPLALMAGVLVEQPGVAGMRAAEEWIGRLSQQHVSAAGDPGYLALGQAIHALGEVERGTAGALEGTLGNIALHCENAWAEALGDAARRERAALLRRLIELAPGVAAIAVDRKRLLELLAIYLDDEDARVRIDALRALGGFGARAPIEALVEALDDRSWKVRAEAIQALQQISHLGVRAVSQALVHALGHRDGMVRDIAKAALQEMGERAPIDLLVNLLGDYEADYQGREQAALVLGALGERAPIEPLVHALSDSLVLREAAAALARLGERGFEPLREGLRQALNNPYVYLRYAAVDALVELGDRADDLLQQALSDEDQQVRSAASWAQSHIRQRARAASDVGTRWATGQAAIGQAMAQATQQEPEALPLEAVIRAQGDKSVAAAVALIGPTEVNQREEAATKTMSEPPSPEAIAALVRGLNDRKKAKRREAAAALGRLGEQAPVEPLLRAFGDFDAGTRRAAAAALGRLGERAIEPLLRALEDTSWQVRQAAVSALGQAGERIPVEALVRAVDDRDGGVRREAVEALGHLGERAPREVLLRALGDANWRVRWAAAQVLSQMRAWNLETLLRMMEDREARVREVAAEALGMMSAWDERMLEPLLRAVGGRYAEVRRAAIVALGQWGKRAPIEPLVAALAEDRSGRVRRAAAVALGRVGERVPVEALARAVLDRTPGVRAAAAAALGQAPERAPSEPLLAVLGDHDQQVREAAARTLGRFGARAPVEALVRALNDYDKNRRWAAAGALGALGERAPIEPLARALCDVSGEVRQAAVRALGQLGERAPIEPLVRALGDTDQGLRQAAAEVLAQRAPERLEEVRAEARSIVRDGVRDPERLPVLGSIVQTQVAGVLGNSGRPIPAYVDYLARLLDWPYWQVQATAAKALGRIRRRIPDAAIARLYALRNDAGQPEAVRLAADDALAEILAVDPMEDDA